MHKWKDRPAPPQLPHSHCSFVEQVDENVY